MLIVAYRHLAHIKAQMDAIQARYPMSWETLAYETEKLKREIILPLAVLTPIEQLSPGKNYGTIEFHMGATAFDSERRPLLNHGDIYLVRWTWSGPEGDYPGHFYGKNGWDDVSIKKPERNLLMLVLS